MFRKVGRWGRGHPSCSGNGIFHTPSAGWLGQRLVDTHIVDQRTGSGAVFHSFAVPQSNEINSYPFLFACYKTKKNLSDFSHMKESHTFICSSYTQNTASRGRLERRFESCTHRNIYRLPPRQKYIVKFPINCRIARWSRGSGAVYWPLNLA